MSDEDESKTPSKVLKNAYDVQRMKLEKLMKNPVKPVLIPERPKEKKALYVPDFVRNVMGSSAGAGSGEFHVYRHLRRKEYARQKIIAEMSDKERLDYEFQQKLLENERKAEERTAKKRAKRLKKKAKRKEKLKEKKLKKSDDKSDNKTESDTSFDSESEEEDNKPNPNNLHSNSRESQPNSDELQPNSTVPQSNSSEQLLNSNESPLNSSDLQPNLSMSKPNESESIQVKENDCH